jgi:hypothetical protein
LGGAARVDGSASGQQGPFPVGGTESARVNSTDPKARRRGADATTSADLITSIHLVVRVLTTIEIVGRVKGCKTSA